MAEGLGVAIISRLAAGNELASQRLVHVPLRNFVIRRPLYQAERRGHRPSKSAIAFLCLLKHAVRGTLPKLKPSTLLW